MSTINEIRKQEADRRRARLAELIRLHFNDKQSELVARIDGNQGEISALIGTDKSFGGVKARGLEEKAGLIKGSLDADVGEPFYASGKHPLSLSDESKIREHNPALIADLPEKSGAILGNNDVPHRKLSDSSSSVRHAGDNYSAGPDVKPRFYPEISWVQAGMWTEIAENFVVAEDTKMYQCHIDLGEDGFVLRVDGMSMTAPPGVFPTFPPGMLLFVRPHEDAMPGKHVIVRRNGNTATFKKLVVIDGDLYLEALNPDWPNQYMRLQADDVFCGVVMLASFDLS